MSKIVTKTFTKEYSEVVNKLITHVDIIGNKIKVFHAYSALWDTGATVTCISKNVATSLHLVPITEKEATTPLGSKNCKVYIIDIILDNDVRIDDVYAYETEIGNENIDILVGMDVIQRGEFVISNIEGKTKFSFSIID